MKEAIDLVRDQPETTTEALERLKREAAVLVQQDFKIRCGEADKLLAEFKASLIKDLDLEMVGGVQLIGDKIIQVTAWKDVRK